MSSSEIEDLIHRMIQHKDNLLVQAEEQRSAKDKLEVVLKEKWVPKRNSKEELLKDKLSEVGQIVKLEVALMESVKMFVPKYVAERMAIGLEKVRDTNNLISMNTVSLRHRHDPKVRQVVKLVNSVYRYNRDIISGYSPNPGVKSRITSATLCPHCGETAKAILFNLMATKAVLLPI